MQLVQTEYVTILTPVTTRDQLPVTVTDFHEKLATVSVVTVNVTIVTHGGHAAHYS
jgi:hypothetical protein